MQGAGAWSLVGELRSHGWFCATKRLKKKKKSIPLLWEAKLEGSLGRSWEVFEVLDTPLSDPPRSLERHGKLTPRDGELLSRVVETWDAIPGDLLPWLGFSWWPWHLSLYHRASGFFKFLLNESHEYSRIPCQLEWKKPGHPPLSVSVSSSCCVWGRLGSCPSKPSRTWIACCWMWFPWNCTLGQFDPDVPPSLPSLVCGGKVLET